MKRVLPVVFMLGIFGSCYTDNYEALYPTGGCNTDSVTYSGRAKGIFTQNCAISGCHNTASAMSGVILDTYNGAKIVANDGRLVGAITHASGFPEMPKDQPKLDDCTISQITKWVQLGAPNN